MRSKTSKQYGMVLPGILTLDQAYKVIAAELARLNIISLALKNDLKVWYRTDNTGINGEMIGAGWPKGWTAIKVTWDEEQEESGS